MHPTAHGARVTRVTAYVGRQRVGRARSGRLRVRLVGFAHRTVRVKLVIDEIRHRHPVRLREYRHYPACRPAKG